VKRFAPNSRTEGFVATAFALLTLADVALGLARPYIDGRGVGALARFALTGCTVVTLLVGPGFAIAKLRGRPLGESLGFSLLPGLALLVGSGLLAWFFAAHLRPELTCAIIAVPVAFAIAVLGWRSRPVLDRFDRTALVVVALAFLVAAGRGLYSVDPVGDIYRGTVSQTNDASRPDSRIQFHVVQLIANGVVPWTAAGEQNFRPYDFSSRGPLAGLAAAPAVLLIGARPDMSPDFQTWAPFDSQGFMAYRLAMEAFAAFSLLFLYGLARRLLGAHNAVFALLFAALTPFVVHEIFFTWPKLLAAGLIIGSAHALLRGWGFRAGLLAGAAYLVHPLGLLAVPTLVLLLLTRFGGPDKQAWKRRGLRMGGLLLGVALCWAAWRVVNGSSYTQEGFLSYITGPAPLSRWIALRADSLASTLVPLWAAVTHAGDFWYDMLPGHAHPSVLVAIDYSCALPMAVGLVFSPLFLLAMWRAFRDQPFVFVAVAIVPLVIFWIYWGANATGLIREGLHPWFLTLLLLYACARRPLAQRWGWWPRWERGLLLTRPVESLFVLVGPSIITNGVLVSRLTDVPALVSILIGIGGLSWLTWQLTGPGAARDGALAAESGRVVRDGRNDSASGSARRSRTSANNAEATS